MATVIGPLLQRIRAERWVTDETLGLAAGLCYDLALPRADAAPALRKQAREASRDLDLLASALEDQPLARARVLSAAGGVYMARNQANEAICRWEQAEAILTPANVRLDCFRLSLLTDLGAELALAGARQRALACYEAVTAYPLWNITDPDADQTIRSLMRRAAEGQIECMRGDEHALREYRLPDVFRSELQSKLDAAIKEAEGGR